VGRELSALHVHSWLRQRGIELTLVNRGRHKVSLPPGVKSLTVDVHDVSAARESL